MNQTRRITIDATDIPQATVTIEVHVTIPQPLNIQELVAQLSKHLERQLATKLRRKL